MTTNIKIIITTKTRNIITCIVRCKMIIKITTIYIGKITTKCRGKKAIVEATKITTVES